MNRVGEQDRARQESEAARAATEAPLLASIQAELDALNAECLAWLQANPRPQTVLAYTDGSASGIVVENRGWSLGRYFLTDDGLLHALDGKWWWSTRHHKPDHWEALLAREAARLNVKTIGVSRSWGGNRNGAPQYGLPALTLMHPVIQQTSNEHSVRSELYRQENGVVMASGTYEPFTDIIARELLKLEP